MSTFLSRRMFCAGTASAVTAWQHHKQYQEEDTLRLETAPGSLPAAKSLPTTKSKPSFPTSAWKEQLIPTGLDSQSWLGRETSIVKSPVRLFNGTITSCEAAPVEAMSSVDALAVPSEPIPDWRKQLLPPALHAYPFLERIEIVTENKRYGTAHTTELYLLGTYHGSQKSAENAKVLLEAVDPDLIFVELCDERSGILGLSTEQVKSLSFPWLSVVREAFSSGMSVQHSLGFVGVAAAQHWIAKHGSGLAGDFRPAYDYLQRKDRNRFLVLGDRPKSVTMSRMADLGKLAKHTANLEELYGNEPEKPISDLKELKARGDAVYNKAWEEQKTWTDFIMSGIVNNEDLIASWMFSDDGFSEMQFFADTEMRVILQERDIYMACKLIQLCHGVELDRIVVLVGMGHARGMTHLLNAGIIGTTRDPEEVLSHLIASERYPKDDPYLQNLLTHFVCLHNGD